MPLTRDSLGVSAWCEQISSKLNIKMLHALERANEVHCIPYRTDGSAWRSDNYITWWTNGFWPATMLRMYLLAGGERYLIEARHAEAMLDEALRHPKDLHHDVGFMWNISSGVHYRLTGDETSLRRWLQAADLLAARYNPNGFLRAWNGPDQAGWAIIDSMMNIPLLYRISDFTNDPRYGLIARRHADTTLRHFLREDGSCNHIVIFDPHTGEPLATPAGQGVAPGSSWSRGQAWALYGFALSHAHTGEPLYLDAAKRVAHYFISCVMDDWIPDCDFRAPKEPVVKDNCAGAIAACGMLEIANHVPECERALYENAALSLLKAMETHCADWSADSPAIFTQCTVAYHDEEGRNTHLQYADYFFTEGIHRLKDRDAMLFW